MKGKRGMPKPATKKVGGIRTPFGRTASVKC